MEELNWGFSRREKLGLFGITAFIFILFLSSQFLDRDQISLKKEDITIFQTAIEKANANRKLIADQREEKRIANYKAYQNKYKKEPKPKFKSKYKNNNTNKIASKNKTESPSAEKSTISNVQNAVLSFFNPNSASLEDFVKLGIPSKTANTIVNFRNKGGKFLKAEDLKIVYGLSDVIYNSIKDYIQIPAVESKPTYDKPKAAAAAAAKLKIDLNQSTAEELMKLRGIGPTLSRRIVKYRDKLGGFANIDQLTEVYNLPDSTLNSIKSNLVLNKEIVKRSISTLSFADLKIHPYIDKSIMSGIITRADRNEKFANWNEFEKYFKITPKQLENIQQYFTIP